MQNDRCEPADVLSDGDVIAQVLAGETQQFAILVRRYQAALFRHALSMVLDAAAAADMVQDAFVRTYARLRDCRDPERYRAWVFQTLRNRCLDYLKEASRRTTGLEMAESVADLRESPAEKAEREQLGTFIGFELSRLHPVQREAFVMHYVDGVPYDEMAEMLGTSVSAVKMRALRAREALAGALGRRGVTPSASVSSPYPRVRASVVSGTPGEDL